MPVATPCGPWENTTDAGAATEGNTAAVNTPAHHGHNLGNSVLPVSCGLWTIRPIISIKTELVALDVLHYEARFVVIIGWQESYACCSEGDQTCTFALQRSKTFLAHESGTDPYVQM